MEYSRKIAIGVVMIVPTFVFSGLVWSWFHSWWGVIVAVAVMIYVYRLLLAGKFQKLFRISQRVET